MNKTSTLKKIKESINTKMNEQPDNEKEFPYEPGANVINSILNYSRALSIRESKRMRHFEMVLN